MGGPSIYSQICDFCGTVTEDTVKCDICSYDICKDDTFLVTTAKYIDTGQAEREIYCRSCYYLYVNDQPNAHKNTDPEGYKSDPSVVM